jgi:hypothetical protein
VLGLGPRASSVLGEHFTTELYPQPWCCIVCKAFPCIQTKSCKTPEKCQFPRPLPIFVDYNWWQLISFLNIKKKKKPKKQQKKHTHTHARTHTLAHEPRVIWFERVHLPPQTQHFSHCFQEWRPLLPRGKGHHEALLFWVAKGGGTNAKLAPKTVLVFSTIIYVMLQNFCTRMTCFKTAGWLNIYIYIHIHIDIDIKITKSTFAVFNVKTIKCNSE